MKTINNGDSGLVVRNAINDNFLKAVDNPIAMLAEGNNEFICMASIIARPTGSAVNGVDITWEILTNTSNHGSSFIRSVQGQPSNGLLLSYPKVKSVLAGIVSGDESYRKYLVSFGCSIGIDSTDLFASRPANGGFSLVGNGTNWTAAGVFSGYYSLASYNSGLTAFDLPASVTAFDRDSIQITYTGENNYRVKRKYSGLPGSAGLAFYLVDNTTNAVITTPPTADDHVHVSCFGQGVLELGLKSWNTQNSGNAFMAGGNFNFWYLAMFELWMKVFVVNSTELLAKWQSKSGVTTYKLYRDTASNLATKTLIYSGTALEFKDTGLTANTMYYYQLCDQTDTEITQFNTRTKAS